MVQPLMLFLMENEQGMCMLIGCDPALVPISPESKVVECWSPPSIEHEVRDVGESPSTGDHYPSQE